MSVVAVWQDLFTVVASFGLVSFAVWIAKWTQRQRARNAAAFGGAHAFAAALLLAGPLMLPDWLWLARGGWPAMISAGGAALVCAIAAVLMWYGLINAPSPALQAGKSEDDLVGISLAIELDDTRKRLRELSEVSGDWVWQSDDRGLLTYVSEGVRPVLGVGPEELIGRKLLEIGEAGAAAKNGEDGRRLIASQAVFRNLPLSCQYAGGESRQILLSGSPRFDATGAFCGYSGVANDTTAERRLSEARAAAQAKDSFFASMSHEIRTPLNGVLGILDILRDTTLTEDQHRFVATAADSGESLLHLINDILDLSKIEAGRFEVHPEPADLARSVRLAVDSVRSLASKNGTTIDVEGLDGLTELLEFDPHRYRQVLLNLLSNAIKFTRNGKIRVRIEPGQRSTRSTIIRTSVTDTGPGIAPESQKLLFLEFSKLHDPGSMNPGGTGLGLALSRRLAQAMGGDTGVESEVGKGSNFWFEIAFAPCKSNAAKVMPSVTSIAFPSSRSAKSILLAEDNPTNVLVATRMLASEGHKVVHATNGQQAIEAFKRQPFDMILMDISMPVMDGITAAREIRRLEAMDAAAATPIVALTAHAISSEREKIIAAGMSGFLTKPVRKHELLAEIARHGRDRAPESSEAPAPATSLNSAAPADREASSQPEMANSPAIGLQTTTASKHASASGRTDTVKPMTTSNSASAPAVAPKAAAPVARSAPFAAARKSPHLSEVVLDRTVLRELEQDAGVEAMPVLIQLFVKEIGERSGELQRARTETNVMLLKSACHAIAGSSGTLGARRLHSLCKRVEDACIKRPDVKYLDVVPVVQGEIDQLLGCLAESTRISPAARASA